MKIFSVFLALLAAFPPSGRTADISADVSGSTWPVTAPLTVTAPRVKDSPALKTARAAGAGAALTGTGLMAYVVFINAAGPFGWAAALAFLGGMTAYLSHRRLQGKDDFTWSAPPSTASQDRASGASPPEPVNNP